MRWEVRHILLEKYFCEVKSILKSISKIQTKPWR